MTRFETMQESYDLEMAEQRRIDRYEAAYARQPETEEERLWAEHSVEVLWASYKDKVNVVKSDEPNAEGIDPALQK